MKYIRIILFLTALAALAVSCSPASPVDIQKVPETRASMEAPTPEKISSTESWRQEWDKTLKAARTEGKVLITSTTGPSVRNILGQAFQDKFGIQLEFNASKGAEVTARISAERKAGLYLADVYTGSSTTMLNELKPMGALDALKPVLFLPEVLDGSNWYSGKLAFTDKNGSILAFAAAPSPSLVVNSSLARPGEITSYMDLLQPKWKGRMIMNDPTRAGIGLKWFGVVSQNIMNVNFMRGLAKQEPMIITDQRLQIDWLSRGKYAILIAPKSNTFAEFYEAGAPVSIVIPAEGTYLAAASGNAGFINKAPHPNAARLFINWLLSREGQTLWTKAELTQSARLDAPVGHLPAEKRRDPGIKYFWSETEDFLSQQPEQAKLAREIFGHPMK